MQKKLPTVRNARNAAPLFAIRGIRYRINKKLSSPPKKARGEALSPADKEKSARRAHPHPRKSPTAGRKKLVPYAPNPTQSVIVFHLEGPGTPELT